MRLGWIGLKWPEGMRWQLRLRVMWYCWRRHIPVARMAKVMCYLSEPPRQRFLSIFGGQNKASRPRKNMKPVRPPKRRTRLHGTYIPDILADKEPSSLPKPQKELLRQVEEMLTEFQAQGGRLSAREARLLTTIRLRCNQLLREYDREVEKRRREREKEQFG